MNDGEILQQMTTHICKVIGIRECIIRLTTNKISQYKGKIATINLRTEHKDCMLPIRDVWVHELAHHVQVCIQGYTYHDYYHKMIIISLLDYLGIKNYAWHKEYKSYR